MNNISTSTQKLEITSSDFQNGGLIPQEFTCDGENMFPSIVVNGLKNGENSLVVIVDDPDAPNGTWVHMVAYNIPVGSEKEEINLKNAVFGVNSFGKMNWGGPCPPKGNAPHHYHFKVYGLRSQLDTRTGLMKDEVLKGISGLVVSYDELVGLYERK